MIKFRCWYCAQKIAVNDAGAGVSIPCPTCATAIEVPQESAAEFRAVAMEVLPAEPAPATTTPTDSPQLSRLAEFLLGNKVIVALLRQWRQLLDTQETGTAQIAAFEERLGAVQERYGTQLADYRSKIDELELELVMRIRQARRLQEENTRLSRRLRRLEQPVDPIGSGVDVGDARSLLHL